MLSPPFLPIKIFMLFQLNAKSKTSHVYNMQKITVGIHNENLILLLTCCVAVSFLGALFQGALWFLINIVLEIGFTGYNGNYKVIEHFHNAEGGEGLWWSTRLQKKNLDRVNVVAFKKSQIAVSVLSCMVKYVIDMSVIFIPESRLNKTSGKTTMRQQPSNSTTIVI